MNFGHCVLATACAVCLGACSGVPGTPELRSGTVADVYVETAPGLFVERRLAAGRRSGSVAVVNLVDVPAGAGSTATAWVAPGTGLARGDVVSVRLGRARGHAPDEVVPAGDRVVAVLPAAEGAVAVTGFDDR